MEKQLFKIGQIINTHGIKGEVKVYPLTEDVNKFKRLKTGLVGGVPMNILGVKFQKDRVILKLEGVDTMNDAETYKQKYIEIPRDEEPELPEDTYYIVDLIGLDVYSDEGNLLGKLDDIFNNGSCDIYVVKDELGKQLLLPAISDVIKEINLEQKKIVVHILKGLI